MGIVYVDYCFIEILLERLVVIVLGLQDKQSLYGHIMSRYFILITAVVACVNCDSDRDASQPIQESGQPDVPPQQKDVAAASGTPEAEPTAVATHVPADDYVIITENSHNDLGGFRIRWKPRADVDGLKPREVVARSLRLIKMGDTDEAKKYWTLFYPTTRNSYTIGTYHEFCEEFQSFDQVELCSLGRSKGHYTVWMKCRRDGEVIRGGNFAVDEKDGRWLIARWTHW